MIVNDDNLLNESCYPSCIVNIIITGTCILHLTTMPVEACVVCCNCHKKAPCLSDHGLLSGEMCIVD